MDKIWYYMNEDKEKYGPYTDHDLLALIEQEIVRGNTFIWMPDFSSWIKVKNSIYASYLPA